MRNHWFSRIAIFAAIVPISACAEQTTTRLKVVDEMGEPIHGATAGVVYYSQTPSSVAGDNDDGITSEDGLFVFSGKAYWLGQIGATKDGFYGSSRELEVTEPDNYGQARVKNEIDATLTLREIHNPVPMYVRRLQIRAPITEEELGFDFFANDWVSPYGSGEAAHVYIKFTGTMDPEGIRNLMTWRFPNEEDGILRVEPHKGGSRFVWPYLAPTTGYRETMRWQYTRPDALAINDEDPSVQSAFEPAYWIFRFNTVVDEHGQILSANYGKFYGSLFINGIADQPGHPGFAIQRGAIYVNPEENERSMEFDTSRNLANESLPPYALLRP